MYTELYLEVGREEVRIKEGRECRQERQRESYKVFFILFVTTPPSNLYSGVPSQPSVERCSHL